MADELDKIRSLLEAAAASKEGWASNQHRALATLDVLDEYEQRLVKIEGVEAAHDMLRANDCASVVCASESPRTLEVGVWDHDETGLATIVICPELNDGCSGELNTGQLERHIAQCIAAKLLLEGK